jgi:hypothetical protein
MLMDLAKEILLDKPCPRVWYAITTAVFIDGPLGGEVRSQAWALVSGFALLLIYMTARRFTDIGQSRWWAIPYGLFTVSPYATLLLMPGVDVRLIVLGVIALQLPAMVWPKKKPPVPVEAVS